MIISIILLIICLCVSFAGFNALYHEDYLLALVLHFLGSVVGLFIIKYRMYNVRGLTLPLTFNFCVPILGPLGVAVLAMATRSSGRRGIVEEYAQHIDPEEYRELFSHESREFKPDPQNLYSLSDILKSDLPIIQKRVAIEGLAQMESPQTAAILREALQMGSVEVRFFAASVLGKMEKRLERRLQELKNEDRGTREERIISELAQTYFDFVFFGIVEGTRRDEYLYAALGYALDALSFEKDNTMLALVGRILLQMEQYESAIKIFNLYIQEYPDDTGGWLWRAESYLHNNNYVITRENALKALELGQVPKAMEEAVEFWAKGRQA